MAAKKKKFTLSDISFFSSDFILKNVPFLAFLGFLATIYIANAHYAERNVRNIQLLEKEIKEKRWYYRSLQSENMVNSKRSSVVSDVKKDGLKLRRGKPKKVIAK